MLKYTLLLVTALLVACSEAAAPDPDRVLSIRWADGDSGEINGVRFRLSGVDAPETAPVSADRGAKCPAERKRGQAARDYMRAITAQSELRYEVLEEDRFGRQVVRLFVDGEDLAQLALEAGHLQEWPHRGGRPTTAKPDWCAR